MKENTKLGIALVILVVIFQLFLYASILAPSVEIIDTCNNANNDYIMWNFNDEEPTSQANYIKLEFDDNCHLKYISKYIEEDNLYEILYFSGSGNK